MSSYYIGIDLGTSGVKAIALEESGKMLALASQNYSMETPVDGWAQQEPDMWWQYTKQVICEVAVKAKNHELKGIGLTAQMLGATFLDKDLKSIRPCILWCDQRSATERDEIENMLGLNYILDKTANYPLTGYWLPKLKWLEKNEPESFNKIDKILFPKDYIRLMLTGELVTEVSDAGGSSLFDVANRRWSWELIEQMKYPKSWFVNVVESHEITGTLRENVAKELGLKPGVPVVGGAGDQLAGGIGSGIVEQGIASSTIGTSGVVFASTDEVKIDTKSRGIHSFCHGINNQWAVFGCTLAAGGSYKWMRDQLASEEKRYADASGADVYNVMDVLASNSQAGSKGLVFLPYMIGERTPYPDPYAKGTFFGLSLRHNRADMLRAVMEGVTFSLRDSVEILREFNVELKQVRASGGGGKSQLWRQMQADIFNAEVITLNYDEGPALGAAILAAVGIGAYSSAKQACQTILKPVSKLEPNISNVKLYEELYGVYRELYPALKPVFAKHAKLEALK